MAKNLPAMQENWVQSLGQEDSLEEGIATHSSSLAWESHDRAAWRATPHWVAKSDLTEQLTFSSKRRFYLLSVCNERGIFLCF